MLTVYNNLTRDQLVEILDAVDATMDGFRLLGIPGHEAAHHLGAFRKGLKGLIPVDPCDVFLWPDHSFTLREDYDEEGDRWRGDDFEILPAGTKASLEVAGW